MCTNLTSFLDSDPAVTLVGFGSGERIVGTMTLIAHEGQLGRPKDCAGNVPADVSGSFLKSETRVGEAYTEPGDSGGPLLVGDGPMPAGIEAPTTLTAAIGLDVSKRYVTGVASLGGAHPIHASFLDADNARWLSERLDDFDGDHVPNDEDNCVTVVNPGQQNCNADAETDMNGLVLGDACDPNPCPQASMPVRSSSLDGPLTPCVDWAATEHVQNKIELNTLGSRNEFTGVEVADKGATGSGVRTYFRFCVPDRILGVSCRLDQAQQQHEQLHEPPNPNNRPLTPWLPMTLVEYGLVGYGTATVLGQVDEQPFLNYPQKKTYTWD